MYLSCSQGHFDMAVDHEILRGEVGSTATGTNVGPSDRDLMGVTVMPPYDVLGLEPFESLVWRTAESASARSGPEDTDLAIYSLTKYLRLAAAGNPSILTLMYIPHWALDGADSLGLQLRASRDLFVTKAAGERYLGYMRAQRSRMTDSRAGTRAPRSNRPELVALHGYDTKFAMHMLRLGLQGIELMETGTITLPMKAHRDELLAVRSGAQTFDDVIERGLHLEARLETLIEAADLPEKADRGHLNDLSTSLHLEAWGL